MSRACDLYVPNKFHARYRRVEYALNAFGARLKHAIVRSMCVSILLDVASVACPKRVLRRVWDVSQPYFKTLRFFIRPALASVTRKCVTAKAS